MTPFEKINRVTSAYGYREYYYQGQLVKETHRGIDVVPTKYAGEPVAEADWQVRECTGGTVLRISQDSSRGKYVDVQTAENTFERYQHMDEIWVTVGQAVAQGEVLGVAGSTGKITGRHLHFGVYRGGSAEANAINPSDWLGLPNVVGTYEGNNTLDNPTPVEGSPKLWRAVYGPVSEGDKAQVDELAERQGVPVEWEEVTA